MYPSQRAGSDSSYVENGLHPVPKSSEKMVDSPQHTQYGQYKEVSDASGATHGYEKAKSKRKICGVDRALFILWCILGFLLAVVVVVGGVFGSMLARQGAEILDLKTTAATNDSSNVTVTPTSAAPAATTTWVEVLDWEYVGCFEDKSERVFPDKSTVINSLTNRLCAGACEGFEYFGTEHGDQCYCSKTAPVTAAPAWNCNMHCNGASTSEICGGYFFLSAWKKKTA
ncbi:WSC domain-containing protein-like protein 2 [Colletotrichum chlorophyti]|uniref:WSC domain-containing protein-like protein 2 n=1 Tax=Colletotrichum chlorophyti TaxID=708187 RepID=A0A1Q8S989_9PEZI|nr:WSC domain-containing protein-like protein 2 [Colletotrichum chlorophyti]